jgi:peptidoglycan/LPS O-acetylase OafA/YrhL
MFGFRPADYAGARTPLTTESFLYLLIANIILIGQDIVLFQAFTPDGQLYFTANFQLSEPQVFSLMPLPQAWTLSLELMFYILAPLLVQRKTRVLLLVIAASLAVRLYTYLGAGLYHDPWTYRFFPSELAFFVSGMVSYRLYLRIKKSPLGNAGAAIAATTVILSITLGYQLLPRGIVTQWTYYGMLFCLLPWLFIFSDRHRMSDGWIGELSYPIYISHVLVLLALSPLLKSVPTAHNNVVVCTSTVLFSLALMRFVSTPLENYRQQRVKVAAHNKPRNEALPAITRELAG